MSVSVSAWAQETALEMIHNIREAFNELLAENAWMDDETRAVAKEKADAMNERIGYPDMLTNPEELNQEYIMVRGELASSQPRALEPAQNVIVLFSGVVVLVVVSS